MVGPRNICEGSESILLYTHPGIAIPMPMVIGAINGALSDQSCFNIDESTVAANNGGGIGAVVPRSNCGDDSPDSSCKPLLLMQCSQTHRESPQVYGLGFT